MSGYNREQVKDINFCCFQLIKQKTAIIKRKINKWTKTKKMERYRTLLLNIGKRLQKFLTCLIRREELKNMNPTGQSKCKSNRENLTILVNRIKIKEDSQNVNCTKGNVVWSHEHSCTEETHNIEEGKH